MSQIRGTRWLWRSQASRPIRPWHVGAGCPETREPDLGIVAKRAEQHRSEEIPPWCWDLPSCSDAWEAYRKMLSADVHTICDKGSGKTSIVEALNTKWRQRQSGLVRKSCGVSWRIFDDIFERFLILVDQHNRQCIQKWQLNQKTQSP